MIRTARFAMLAAGVALLGTAAGAADGSKAPLLNNDGKEIGQIVMTEAPKGLLLRLDARNLVPGWHGIHVHNRGDCSDATFQSAGAHVHAGDDAAIHGLLRADANEAGDLPNIHVAADGTVKAELYTPQLSLDGAEGRTALRDKDGSAIIIHENADDHQTQPIGGAGARVACAVIP